MNIAEKILPEPVLRRLPRYLIYVRELADSGQKWVSSVNMSAALGLTSSTVRQDLSHLDLSGVSKRGYEINRLIDVLVQELGVTRSHRVLIAGAGYLGSALALHGSLVEHGFDVCAVMDVDPAIIGSEVGPLKVQPMASMQQVVDDLEIDIGIIAVPANEAQDVADEMVSTGLTALLNLALVHINAPSGVTVSDARIVVGLQELAYDLRTKRA